MNDPQAISMRLAQRRDVAAIVALLADDELGRDREVVADPPLPAYFAAFDRIAADPNILLAVAEDGSGAVIGTLQLAFLPGLSKQGSDLAVLEAVRVASPLRGAGIGRQMLVWAMDEARRRGCRDMELLSHNSRTDAHRFYAGLGFAASHQGMKRKL